MTQALTLSHTHPHAHAHAHAHTPRRYASFTIFPAGFMAKPRLCREVIVPVMSLVAAIQGGGPVSVCMCVCVCVVMATGANHQ